MCQGESLVTVLRLLVLMSVTAGGVPKKHFDVLRREVLHTYGHENVMTLSNLQDAGRSSLATCTTVVRVPASSTQAFADVRP